MHVITQTVAICDNERGQPCLETGELLSPLASAAYDVYTILSCGIPVYSYYIVASTIANDLVRA